MQPKTRSCQTCVFPEQARKRPRPPFFTPPAAPPAPRGQPASRHWPIPTAHGPRHYNNDRSPRGGSHAASRDRPWPWTRRRPPAQSQALNRPKALTPCVIHIAGYSMRKMARPALCPTEQPLDRPPRCAPTGRRSVGLAPPHPGQAGHHKGREDKTKGFVKENKVGPGPSGEYLGVKLLAQRKDGQKPIKAEG